MSSITPNSDSVEKLDSSLNRVGERGNVPDRSGRFLNEDGEWYFRTREGAIEGPFTSRSRAGRGLSEFLEFLAMATPRVPLHKH